MRALRSTSPDKVVQTGRIFKVTAQDVPGLLDALDIMGMQFEQGRLRGLRKVDLGDFVRDKDAVSSCALMAEIAAWAISKGKTLYEMLQDIYLEYGYSKEKMKYIVRKGKSGAEEIQQIMTRFRKEPPKVLGGSLLEWVKDYSTLIAKNVITGEEKKIDQKITSNVLQFFTKEGTKISVRPSGTEPKIKFYFEVKGELKSRKEFEETEKKSEVKIDLIMEELGL